MGYGEWKSSTFAEYTVKTKSCSLDDLGTYKIDHSQIFKARNIAKDLKPYNVMRECVDSDEHPNTIPVILALDVTGSMGNAAVDVAGKLNKIMTSLYNKVTDVEFMIMGIGDFAYDHYPLQVSQFESDIRIAKQLDQLYFEFGGGSNPYESYSAAWYFANKHTKLDCWKRGKKGIIITMGDEEYNPYIPAKGYNTSIKEVLGDDVQGKEVDSDEIYKEVSKKYDIYHIDVVHDAYYSNGSAIKSSWLTILDYQHFFSCTIEEISDTIVDIITTAAENNTTISFVNSDIVDEDEETVAVGAGMQEISW